MPSKRIINGYKIILYCVALVTLLGTGLFFSSTQPTYPDTQPITSETVETIATEPEVIFAKQRTFGYSEKGRPIDGYEIGSGAECMLFFGGIHGNEKGTAELLREFITAVADEPDLLAPNKKLFIVPFVNPDGYFDDIYRTNANGVNLNRNFPTTNWIQYPDTETFAGTKPFSESESRVLSAIVDECTPSLMIAFHSQGGVISPEANAESAALGNWYASKTNYTIYNDWNYPGTATQWFTITTGKPAITVEISSHDKSDWEINRSALLELIGG